MRSWLLPLVALGAVFQSGCSALVLNTGLQPEKLVQDLTTREKIEARLGPPQRGAKVPGTAYLMSPGVRWDDPGWKYNDVFGNGPQGHWPARHDLPFEPATYLVKEVVRWRSEVEAGRAITALDVMLLGVPEVLTFPLAVRSKSQPRQREVRLVVWYDPEGRARDWLMYEYVDGIDPARREAPR